MVSLPKWGMICMGKHRRCCVMEAKNVKMLKKKLEILPSGNTKQLNLWIFSHIIVFLNTESERSVKRWLYFLGGRHSVSLSLYWSSLSCPTSHTISLHCRTPPLPWGSKFFHFHAVFGPVKISHRTMAAKDGCIDFMFLDPSPYPAAGSANDSWIRHCRPPFMVSF